METKKAGERASSDTWRAHHCSPALHALGLLPAEEKRNNTKVKGRLGRGRKGKRAQRALEAL